MPMGRKQKKWMGLYMTLVLIATVGTTTVFAAGDPLSVINNLSTFIFSLIRAIGLILLGFGVAVCDRGSSVCCLWVLQISWDDCRAVFMGSDQIRTSVSEKTGLSVGRSLLFLYAGEHLAGRKEPKGWGRNLKRTREKSRNKTGKETKGKE